MTYIILVRLRDGGLVSIESYRESHDTYPSKSSILEFDSMLEASLFADLDPTCDAQEYEILEVRNI